MVKIRTNLHSEEAGSLQSRISQLCADKYREKWEDSWRSKRRQNNSENCRRQARFILSLCAVKMTSPNPETLFIWITYCGNIGNLSFLVFLLNKFSIYSLVLDKLFEMYKTTKNKEVKSCCRVEKAKTKN